MKIELLLILLLFLIIILNFSKKSYIPCSYSGKIPIINLIIGNYIATVEVIDKLGSGTIGLMNRNYLPENYGMLFVFDVPIKAYFWNKNTKIAIDIAFLDSQGTILEIF